MHNMPCTYCKIRTTPDHHMPDTTCTVCSRCTHPTVSACTERIHPAPRASANALSSQPSAHVPEVLVSYTSSSDHRCLPLPRASYTLLVIPPLGPSMWVPPPVARSGCTCISSSCVPRASSTTDVPTAELDIAHSCGNTCLSLLPASPSAARAAVVSHSPSLHTHCTVSCLEHPPPAM